MARKNKRFEEKDPFKGLAGLTMLWAFCLGLS
jgi:single-stranded DNA-specific DHH superfamily exonuclease